MEKAFTVHLVTYIPILKNAGIRFREDEKTLTSGKPNVNAGYVIIVSCRTVDTVNLLRDALPFLKTSKASFRIIKGQNEQYRLNSGSFGEEETGKVITIFPYDLEEAKYLAQELIKVTYKFKGPAVRDAQRIGEVVY